MKYNNVERLLDYSDMLNDIPSVKTIMSLTNFKMYEKYKENPLTARYTRLARLSSYYTKGFTEKEMWVFWVYIACVFVFGGVRLYSTSSKVCKAVYSLFKDWGYKIGIPSKYYHCATAILSDRIISSNKFMKEYSGLLDNPQRNLPLDIYSLFKNKRDDKIKDMCFRCFMTNKMYKDGKGNTRMTKKEKEYTKLFEDFSHLMGDRLVSDKLGESRLYITAKSFKDGTFSRPHSFGFLNKKSKRQNMYIDGERVVELDTKSSWLSILCIENNKKIVKDQYYMFGIPEENGIDRKKIKSFVTRYITTAGHIAAYIKWYKENYEQESYKEDLFVLNSYVTPILRDMGAKGKYHHLMDIEARVMLKLMEYTIEWNKAFNDNIVFIPNSDGIICKESDVKTLESLYRKAFTTILGNTPNFDVKGVSEATTMMEEPITREDIKGEEIKNVERINPYKEEKKSNQPFVNLQLDDVVCTETRIEDGIKTKKEWTWNEILDWVIDKGNVEEGIRLLETWESNDPDNTQLTDKAKYAIKHFGDPLQTVEKSSIAM